jgi:hypothetical protein
MLPVKMLVSKMDSEEIMRMRKKLEAAETVKLVTIGKVAKLAGVGVETIRFYERAGVASVKEKGVGLPTISSSHSVHPQSSRRRLFAKRRW